MDQGEQLSQRQMANLMSEAECLMRTCANPPETANEIGVLLENLSRVQYQLYEEDIWFDLQDCKYKLMKLMNQIGRDNAPVFPNQEAVKHSNNGCSNDASSSPLPLGDASAAVAFSDNLTDDDIGCSRFAKYCRSTDPVQPDHEDKGPASKPHANNDENDSDKATNQQQNYAANHSVNRNGDLPIVLEHEDISTYCQLPDVMQIFNGLWNWIANPDKIASCIGADQNVADDALGDNDAKVKAGMDGRFANKAAAAGQRRTNCNSVDKKTPKNRSLDTYSSHPTVATTDTVDTESMAEPKSQVADSSVDQARIPDEKFLQAQSGHCPMRPTARCSIGIMPSANILLMTPTSATAVKEQCEVSTILNKCSNNGCSNDVTGTINKESSGASHDNDKSAHVNQDEMEREVDAPMVDRVYHDFVENVVTQKEIEDDDNDGDFEADEVKASNSKRDQEFGQGDHDQQLGSELEEAATAASDRLGIG